MEVIPGFSREGLIIGLNKEKGVGVINVGSESGVAQGDVFAVVRIKDKVVDPATGKLVRVIQELIGFVSAVSTSGSTTDVKLDKGAKQMEEGDGVRRKPSRPAGLAAKNIGARKIEMTWGISYEPEVIGYKIYRATEAATGPFGHIDTLSKGDAAMYQDRSSSKFPLEESRVYYYRITSYSSSNKESDPSDTVTIKSKAAPNPPDGLKAEGGKIRSAPLKWTPMDDEDVSGYRIFSSTSAAGPFNKIADLKDRKTADYTDFGGGKALSPELKDSTVYYYQIAAYNGFGAEGPKSSAANAQTAPPPVTPAGFTAKGMQPRMVPLAWDVHQDQNVKGYIIARGDKPDGPFEEITNLKGREINNYVDKGGAGSGWGKGGKPLDDAHLYFYKVLAYNWVNAKSEFTPPVSVMTKPVSFPPEKLAAAGKKPRQVPLEWRPIPDVTIDRYEIFRSESELGKFDKLGETKADKPHYLDEKLGDGKAYFYKIRAVDRFGLVGEFTSIVSATTKPLPAPVTGLKWEIVSGEPTLLWDKNKEPDIKEYNVYQKGFFGVTKLGAAKEAKYVVKGLASGSTGGYAVSPVDSDGLEGKQSDLITVRP
jgi:hypothetical protein